MKESEKYYLLIKNWHTKASEEDYFSKFMFEYLAFIAYLRTQWKSEQEVTIMKGNRGKVTDRDYIQVLKQDSYIREYWIDFTIRSTKDRDLTKILTQLIVFLKKEPLRSDSRWWNFDGFDLNKKPKTRKIAGIVQDIGDIGNLVEFWYSVRNNLFHGEKNPSLKRDQELVRYAFLTLHYFVENILLAPSELRRVYPATWESFWLRFKRGEGEVNTKADGSGVTANIYECAFLKDYHYPILLLNRQLTRSDIIDIIIEELALSEESAIKIWSRLVSAAVNQKKELKQYFASIVEALNKSYNLKLSLK